MSTEPITLTDANIEQVLASDQPVLILVTTGDGLKGDFKVAFTKSAAEERSGRVYARLDPERSPQAAARLGIAAAEAASKPVLVGWYCGEEVTRRARPWASDLQPALDALAQAVTSRNPVPVTEKADPPMNNNKPVTVYNTPINATDATFESEVLNAESGLPVIVDFWAAWCGPCRMVAPVLDKLAKEYAGKIKIVKVDVDANPSLSQAFNIQSIPNLMVIKNRTMLYNQPGALPEASLRQLVEKAIAIDVPPPPTQ